MDFCYFLSIFIQYPSVDSISFKLPTQPKTGFGLAATPSPIIPVTIPSKEAKTLLKEASSGKA